jgi:maltooligosyltrehalose trehalohydrolase
VSLDGSDDALPLQSRPEGWFAITTAKAAAGTRYKYVVDGEHYPDPASRFQPDGTHAASEIIDPAAYRWSDIRWLGRPWEEFAIYELHIGTFSDTGDYAGAIAHLDDLVTLGVTAVELMPLAAFPGARNWGYDGVQIYAPSAAYGRPDDLKCLVEACHERHLAIILDVVYNHFGPEGNYLPAIAPNFFTERHHTPWGAAVNYDGDHSRPVRDFVIDNALYWLEEYRFDGLRLDAVHAIVDDSRPDIITELGETVRRRISDRPVHLILENDKNETPRLERRHGKAVHATAQWNDDYHHAFHVMLTGQTAGYYGDYADRPIEHLGRVLATGLAYQGEPSPFRDGETRGGPSAQLPATAFISFLQNHDQIGNTPFGTRIAELVPEPLLHVAVAISLLAPQIPMLFMGEEWASSRPFLFFCDFAPPLDDAVRQGRRREFAHFPEFSDPDAQRRIPDPTAESTFAASRLDWTERRREPHAAWLARYRHLLQLRRDHIAPRLSGIRPGGEYEPIGDIALRVAWQFDDGSRLLLLANFGPEAAALIPQAPSVEPFYCTATRPPGGELPAYCAAFYLVPAATRAP